MRIDEFKLERYFERHEFSAKYIFCASDCETSTLNDFLSEKELSELHSIRLSYSQAQGNPVLRDEISKMYHNVGSEEIIVSVPEEAIFITMNSLLDPGDNVVVQFPCYQALSEVPRAIGCRVIKWEPEAVQDDWNWSLEFLRKMVNKRTRMIIINSPHNPTGHLFNKKEYDEIIQLARENNCIVFSDEMYRMLEYQNEDQLPIGSDVYEKCISLSGMSKAYGLGGIRIGWLSVREKEALDRIMRFKDYTTISSSALSEYVATVAVRKRAIILSRNLGIIRNNLKLLDTFFQKHKDKFVWLRPKAGPIAFVKTIIDQDIEDFCENVVKQKSVMLMPSTKFEYGDQHIRIGFGRQNMPEALNLFEEYLAENP
jgi:aspartate/methionine/tyrosine aminotransferase